MKTMASVVDVNTDEQFFDFVVAPMHYDNIRYNKYIWITKLES